MNAVIKPGDALRLAEPNYMYGVGDLILRVTKVGRIQRMQDGEWIDLEGIELRDDFSQRTSAPRQVLVRMTALQRSLVRREAKP